MIPDEVICKNLHIYVTSWQSIVTGTRGKMSYWQYIAKLFSQRCPTNTPEKTALRISQM